MKVLLVAEYREKALLETIYELNGFANSLNAEKVFFAVGYESNLPKVAGKLYLADAEKYGEYNPDVHKELIKQVVEKENPDYIVFSHSSYGWDLAPRVAAALKVGQLTEVVAIEDNTFVVPSCNAKLRRFVRHTPGKAVLTIQAGAFAPVVDSASPEVEKIEASAQAKLEFVGYEEAEAKSVDLTKAEIIVTAGRGIGKPDNVPVIEELAKALGGELGASRPVVDAGWVDHSRQVGTTGQTVSPKLYVACGVSGAIQHLAGMKKSDYIIAINTDKDAPIAEAADVLVVADVMQFVPALTSKLK
ncbi:electron transfer flavoprotein subunit alpha/FixB family protein [Deferribacterales bacterium Es71-Z0220]|uniref:electron transfer flavoprotein subunit alpha/FixB family protein n=1 Tax=Deferrivibrio essentukiensis TaxID=2880922 RepID=UPI001F60FEC5|nr:electron transfer flavoprotein subunit alpha/FixB family protein [Deferrivibrio essentukiensis]MCB4204309.1 electron transfer flavoprotein subunit alpha/FixB family protein [Deferrivibrio essentukiensis]